MIMHATVARHVNMAANLPIVDLNLVGRQDLDLVTII